MPTTVNLLLLFLGATLVEDCSPRPSTSTEARSAWCPSRCAGSAATLLSTTEAEFGSRPSDDGSAGCACAVVEEGINLMGDTRIELTAHDDCLVVVGSGQLWASGSDDQDLLRGAGEAERGFLGTRVAPAPALTSSPEPPLETPARASRGTDRIHVSRLPRRTRRGSRRRPAADDTVAETSRTPWHLHHELYRGLRMRRRLLLDRGRGCAARSVSSAAAVAVSSSDEPQPHRHLRELRHLPRHLLPVHHHGHAASHEPAHHHVEPPTRCGVAVAPPARAPNERDDVLYRLRHGLRPLRHHAGRRRHWKPGRLRHNHRRWLWHEDDTRNR